MTIALFAKDSEMLEIVGISLAGEELDVRVIDWRSLRNLQPLGPEIKKAILIVPTHGAGEQTDLVRRVVTPAQRFILCTPKLENEDHQLLRELGVAEIITSPTKQPEDIYERILAQLILEDDFGPVAHGALYGATSVMRALYKRIIAYGNASLTDPVLILGETGTGKELVARELHKLIKRGQRLVDINCGMLSHELAAAQLFGHKKGTFTSATEDRMGMLADAGSGTVFLDEIGDLDLRVQAILLRVIEDKYIRRLGARRTESVPAQIILATNKDLQLECDEGRFRRDLFHRICGHTLKLAPLRRRRADIPLLADHFLTEYNKERKCNVKFPVGAFDCLFNYDWDGNVRELRSVIRDAAILRGASGVINIDHLIQATRRPGKRSPNSESQSPENSKNQIGFETDVEPWKNYKERTYAAYFQALYKATDGNARKAIKLSGLSSSRVYDKFNKLKDS